jgi:hypothetical protein
VRLLALVAVLLSLGIAACGGEDETTTTTTTTGATGEAGAAGAGSIDHFEAALRESLTGAQGLSEAQADCAIDEIRKRVGEEAFQAAADTGDVPDELLEASFDAGVKCANR